MREPELRECMTILGWSPVKLYLLAGVTAACAGGWLSNRFQVRPDTAAWIRFLADTRIANPPPKSKWPRRPPVPYGPVPVRPETIAEAEGRRKFTATLPKRKARTPPPPAPDVPLEAVTVPPPVPTPPPFQQPVGWTDEYSDAIRRGASQRRSREPW